MTRPLIARVTRALAGLLVLATIVSCISEPPKPQRFAAPPRAPITGEIYPTPGRFCLLSAERCPRAEKFERIEDAPQIPSH